MAKMAISVDGGANCKTKPRRNAALPQPQMLRETRISGGTGFVPSTFAKVLQLPILPTPYCRPLNNGIFRASSSIAAST